MTDSDEVKLLPCDIHRRVSRRLTGFLSNNKSADRVAAEIIQMVAATRPPVVTDEVVELREAAAFLCQRMREFGGSDLGRLTGAVEQVERIIVSMPAVVSGGQE